MLAYNLLHRRFPTTGLDDAAFDHFTFSKNCERLLAHRAAPRFLSMIVRIARRKGLVRDAHFSVEGSLTDAWTSIKSVRPKCAGDGGVGAATPRSNSEASGAPMTPTPARPPPRPNWRARARQERAGMADASHALMENRQRLILGLSETAPHDNAKVKAACTLLDEQKRQVIEPDSLGAEEDYCRRGVVRTLRQRKINPHIAMIEGKAVSRLDGRTTGSKSYEVSQRLRKRIEGRFGWLPMIGGTK